MDELGAVFEGEFVPGTHAVRAVWDGEQFAGVSGGLHFLLEEHGLFVWDFGVLGAVDQEEWRHLFVDVRDGRCVVEFLEGFVVDFIEAEQGSDGAQFVGLADAGFEIGRRVEGDDGVDAFLAVCSGVGDEMAAGGFADQREACGVAFVFSGVGFHPADGGVDVIGAGGKGELRCEAVVDAEDGEAGRAQGFEEREDVAGFIALGPGSTVDEQADGEGAGAVGEVGVERECFAGGFGEWDVFVCGRRQRGVGGVGECGGEEGEGGEEGAAGEHGFLGSGDC